MPEITSRERIGLALRHREADRIAVQDAPWGTTISRWRTEGLPENVGPHEYFNYEFAGVGGDNSLQLPTEVVEDTEEYRIERNSNGALVKNWKSSTSTPELLDFLIRDRAAWEQHRERMQMNESRVDWENGLKHCRAAREKGLWVHYSGAMGYDKTAMVAGPTNLLPGMLDDPDWVRDMYEVDAQLHIDIASEMMARGFEFDGAFLYDDMGYRNGTFFSRRTYRELLWPSHRKVCDFFNGEGLPVILHSCGNVNEFVPDLIEAGFACLQPLEVKAGMDLIHLKKAFGDRLAFMGGIDVRAMAAGGEWLEREVREKVICAKQGGGYVYHSDHSVPDNVSFANYCRTIELVKQYGTYAGA